MNVEINDQIKGINKITTYLFINYSNFEKVIYKNILGEFFLLDLKSLVIELNLYAKKSLEVLKFINCSYYLI